MTSTKITRKDIIKALTTMVTLTPVYKLFINAFCDYGEALRWDTDFLVLWDDETDIFEIFNRHSEKSTFLDFSKELDRMN